jgi:predicted nuclease of restriction endonuclease-like RecB superfamily
VKGGDVKKYSYSAQSLDRAIQELEREYGMTTESFYAAYREQEGVDGIPRFTQHVWASFYEDILRMTDGVGVEREPVMTRVGQALVCA